MMNLRILFFLCGLCLSMMLRSQSHTIQSGEYFWDIDPGQGLGSAFTAQDGSFNEIIEAAVMNTSTLPSEGPHRFYVRFRNDANAWGPAFSTIIQIEESVVELREIRITSAEYFWDTDPGEGNGTPMMVYDGNFNEAIEQAVMSGIMGLSIGNHVFHVRVKDAENDWSDTFSVIIRSEEPTTSLREIRLTEAEYFWDVDPGEGNGSAMVALDGNLDEAIERAIMSSVMNLPVGNHIFHVRVRDAEDDWSSTFRVIIETDESTTALREIEITEAEYFWDTDPGQGNGTTMLAFDGNFNEAIEQATMTTVMGLSVGNHILHVRMRDAEGDWSPAFKVVIRADEPTTSLRSIYVSAAEYWFDTDPGAGNGTPMLAVDGNFNEVIEAIKGGEIPSSVTQGVHVLWMRAKEPQGSWGPAFGIVVNMDIDIGTFNTAISGPSSICAGPDQLNVIYACVAASGSTYVWSISGGTIISGQGTTSVTVNWNTGGNHLLSLEQCIGLNCQTDEISVTIEDPADQSQSVTICDGESFFAGGANQTESGVYVDEMFNSNGCPYELTTYLTVQSNTGSTVNASICQGQTYFAGGASQNQSGSYTDVFVSSLGCDSIVVTQLTVHPNYNQTIPVSICEGQTYFAAGAFQTEAGFYTDIYETVFGCDSVVVTQLSIIPGINTTQSVTICEGESFYAGGANQTESGTYVDVIDEGNCTETLTTYLTVLPLPDETQEITICAGQSYFAGGSLQTQSGIYTDPLTIGNCTGTLTTILTVNSPVITTETAEICAGESYYAGGAWQTESGTYVDQYISNGCIEELVTELTVYPSYNAQVSLTLCQGQSIFVGGDWQTSAGAYTDVFTSAHGCDSVVVTLLSFTTGFETEAEAAICEGESIFLGGAMQSSPGIYTDLFESVGGCDSLVYTTLTVIPPQTYEATASICEGESILLGGEFQTESGNYVDIYNSVLGCDSIVITTLTVHEHYEGEATEYICQGDSIFLGGSWQFSPGIYINALQSMHGCDSTVITTLNVLFPPASPELLAINFGVVYCTTPSDSYLWSITVDECEPYIYESTSAEFSISEVQDELECPFGENLVISVQVTNGTCWSESSNAIGFGDIGDITLQDRIDLFPNPASESFTLSNGKTGVLEYRIMNELGQVVQSGRGKFGEPINTNNIAPGTYLVSIRTGNETQFVKLVVL